jgi:hypothetical protein
MVHGAPPASLWQYVSSPDFLSGVLVNWQAAILQLAMLVLLGVFLYQRGAPHSRRLSRSSDLPGKSSRYSWLYRNSLSVGLFGIFILIFILHLLTASAWSNAQRALHQLPPHGLTEFAVSPEFWFMTFQTWQAEFMAIVVYVVLSIYLRQDRSPESKPVSAPDEETGTADT